MNGRRRLRWRNRIAIPVIPFALALAACEDEGNPGDDSLLSGGSLIVVVVLVAVVVGALAMRRRSR